jgi:phosphoribosylformylglycinamidine synthase
MELEDFFGKSPKTVMSDVPVEEVSLRPNMSEISSKPISRMCSNWRLLPVKTGLTIGRRSVTERWHAAMPGRNSVPLSDCGAVALDYRGLQRSGYLYRSCYAGGSD